MSSWEEVNYKINKSGDEYVGIHIKEGLITINLPIGYQYDEKMKDDVKFQEEIRKLLILIAKKTKIDGQNRKNQATNFDIISAIKIINNYHNYGLYRQSEIKRKLNYKGKINWKKTINRNQIYLREKTIYTNVVNEYIDYKCEKEIQEIQKYCLYKISQTVGFLFNFKYPKNVCKFGKEEMVNIISQELKINNEDIKNEILNNLLDFVKNTNLKTLEKGNVAIRYKEFMYIFQNLVDIYGIKSKEKELYNPKAKYCYWKNNELKEMSDPSLPDTIVNDKNQFKAYGNLVFLLDAKYKAIGKNPNEYEVFKQVRYGTSLKENIKGKEILNAFILPGNLEEEVKIMDYYACIDDSDEKIYVVYVDTRKLILETERIMKKVLDRLKKRYELNKKVINKYE